MRPVLLLVLTLASIAPPLECDSLEDAVKSLAAKIAVHLDAKETIRVTLRNLSSLSSPQAARVQAALERDFPKRTRHTVIVPVALTISENLSGYLLVTEIRNQESEAVEMESFKLDPAPALPVLVPISKRLLWRQEQPILDLAIISDHMLVLQPQRLVVYDRGPGGWIQQQGTELNVPPVRDPRGRIELDEQKLTLFFPGATCGGTWQPLDLACEAVTSDFSVGTAKFHFTPGRNTIQDARGRELDDSRDSIPACGGETLASGTGAMDSDDTITLFERSTPVSEAVDLPGPVTALWPAPEGALAVVQVLPAKQYEAYSLSVDCGR